MGVNPVGSSMLKHISFLRTKTPRITGLVRLLVVEPAAIPPSVSRPRRCVVLRLTLVSVVPVTPSSRTQTSTRRRS